jgi:hypothetical protein
MQQSTLIGGAIAAGFLAYLAMTGRLATYWALMTGGAGSGSSGSPGPAPPSQPSQPSVPPSGQVQTGPTVVGSGSPSGASPGAAPPVPAGGAPPVTFPIGPQTFVNPGSPGSATWDILHGMWGSH